MLLVRYQWSGEGGLRTMTSLDDAVPQPPKSPSATDFPTILTTR